MSFKAFLKTRIFTETEHTQSLNFWSNFDPIYPLKKAEIKKSKYFFRKKFSHQAIQISQNQGPISFQFLMKTIVLFALCGFFSLQGQRSRAHVLA